MFDSDEYEDKIWVAAEERIGILEHQLEMARNALKAFGEQDYGLGPVVKELVSKDADKITAVLNHRWRPCEECLKNGAEMRYEEGGDAESGPRMHQLGYKCDDCYSSYLDGQHDRDDLGDISCYLCKPEVMRKVVKEGGIVNPADPTQSYVLECGHVII